MLIRIVRGTVAKPTGELSRAVATGEIIDVDVAQANLLIGLHKATAAAPSRQANVEYAIDPAPAAAEKRTRKGRTI